MLYEVITILATLLPEMAPREADRVDDAVVVELVGDEGGLGAHQRHEGADHRRVGGGEDHRRLAAVEAGETLLELHSYNFV